MIQICLDAELLLALKRLISIVAPSQWPSQALVFAAGAAQTRGPRVSSGWACEDRRRSRAAPRLLRFAPTRTYATKECTERTMTWLVRLCWTRFVRKKTPLTRENRVVKGSVL